MCIQKKLRLSGAENTGREVGGPMLSIDIEGMDADQIKRFALDRKKSCKGKHDDKDDFDGTPQSPVLIEEAAEQL